MGVVVPNGRAERVEFYQFHVGPFTAGGAAIGLAPGDAAELADRVAAARAAYAAQQAAYQTARAATEAYNNAVDALAAVGAALVKKVRAHAELTGDVGVYAAAQLPAPAAPSPRPAPGTPTGLRVALDGNGALRLSWACRNPRGTSGTIYQVWRAAGASEDFAYLGAVGERKFIDASVPAGATRLTYRIQAARSTAVGLWATFTVTFGTGGAAASVVPASARVAA